MNAPIDRERVRRIELSGRRLSMVDPLVTTGPARTSAHQGILVRGRRYLYLTYLTLLMRFEGGKPLRLAVERVRLRLLLWRVRRREPARGLGVQEDAPVRVRGLRVGLSLLGFMTPWRVIGSPPIERP